MHNKEHIVATNPPYQINDPSLPRNTLARNYCPYV